MKSVVLYIVFILFTLPLCAQNTDLPTPTANNQTLPTGSYVIAMDNTNQQNNNLVFNLKVYGYLVTLLNNNKKLKWVISAGKAKDYKDFKVDASSLAPALTTYTKRITTTNGSTAATLNNANFLTVGMTVTGSVAGIQPGTTVTAIVGNNITLSLPATANISNKFCDFSAYAYPVTNYTFKAGPFVVFAADTAGVGTLLTSFNTVFGNANDYIKVYKTTAPVTVDVRYDLTGFKPKAAILDDGANTGIHETFMTACNIPTGNYQITTGTNLLTDCYTFATEAHNSNTGSQVDNAIVAIKRFVEYGGNFLAQCYAVLNYENNALGRFHSTTGISDANSNAGTAITYANPDLSYSQFEGNFSISQGGSLQNWRINAAGVNNVHTHARATGDATVSGASVSKLKSGVGGLVFYLGNHNFNSYTTLVEINGLRMYMNAFLTPVSIAGSCTIGDNYMNPLAAKLIAFQGSVFNSTARLNWEVAENESVLQFNIEQSIDGTHFTASSPIYGNNRAGAETYQQIEKMSSNRIYYRLKITDKNGTVRYSRVILLQTTADDSKGIKIVNNPVNDRLTFEFKATRPGPVEVKILDMLGRVQMTKVISSYEGNNMITLTLPYAWQNGVYVTEIKSGSDRFTAKFVKQQQ